MDRTQIKIIVIVLLSINLLGCSNKSVPDVSGMEVMMEAFDGTSKATMYRDSNRVLLVKDITAVEYDKNIYTNNKAIELSDTNVDTKNYEIDKIYNDITYISPDTYKSTIKQSEDYLKYLEDTGYVVRAYYTSYKCYDVYLSNNSGDNKRLLIFSEKIKILKFNVEKFPDSWTYINERGQ